MKKILIFILCLSSCNASTNKNISRELHNLLKSRCNNHIDISGFNMVDDHQCLKALLENPGMISFENKSRKFIELNDKEDERFSYVYYLISKFLADNNHDRIESYNLKEKYFYKYTNTDQKDTSMEVLKPNKEESLMDELTSEMCFYIFSNWLKDYYSKSPKHTKNDLEIYKVILKELENESSLFFRSSLHLFEYQLRNFNQKGRSSYDYIIKYRSTYSKIFGLVAYSCANFRKYAYLRIMKII